MKRNGTKWQPIATIHCTLDQLIQLQQGQKLLLQQTPHQDREPIGQMLAAIESHIVALSRQTETQKTGVLPYPE